jgi:hypothetical protein
MQDYKTRCWESVEIIVDAFCLKVNSRLKPLSATIKLRKKA